MTAQIYDIKTGTLLNPEAAVIDAKAVTRARFVEQLDESFATLEEAALSCFEDGDDLMWDSMILVLPHKNGKDSIYFVQNEEVNGAYFTSRILRQAANKSARFANQPDPFTDDLSDPA